MAGEADITRRGPLAGCTVLVTRAAHQAAGLAEPLRALGADVLVAPVIDTIDPADWTPADEAIARLAGYDWVVLTSTNAVDRFVERLVHRLGSTDTLRDMKVAVVGPTTAERLAELGITPALVPDDFRAEGLVDAFRALHPDSDWCVLVPRAEKAREILPEALREAGARVDVVPVYRTVPATPDPAVVSALAGEGVDVITFTSPSTVRHFLGWLDGAGLDRQKVMERIAAASIGPVTSEALRSRGYTVAIEATDSTADGLVAAIAAWAGPA